MTANHPTMNRRTWTDRAGDMFSIDLRSLALFRIAVGLVVIGDLVSRAVDLEAHYCDDGVLPRGVEDISRHLILYTLSGELWAQAGLFCIAGVLAVCMALGLFTRTAAFLSWFMVLNLQARNQLVLYGADQLLRVLLFWSLFLPLGQRWSLDTVLRGRRGRAPVECNNRLSNLPTAGLILQVCFMYWFTAILKDDPVWYWDGNAVYYTLSAEQFASHLGVWLLDYPMVMKALTYGTFVLEWVGPLIAISPWFHPAARMVAVVSFFGLHIGFVLFMAIGIFPYAALAAWCVFLPSAFWDRISPRAGPDRAPAWRAGRGTQIAAGCFIVLVLMWNVRTAWHKQLKGTYPYIVNRVVQGLWVNQYWSMFAPHPTRTDAWLVVPADLIDGEQVDLWARGKAVSWVKPELISETYGNLRWWKYVNNACKKKNTNRLLPRFGRYLKESWNREHGPDRQIVRLNIYYMVERTPPPGETATITTHHMLEW